MANLVVNSKNYTKTGNINIGQFKAPPSAPKFTVEFAQGANGTYTIADAGLYFLTAMTTNYTGGNCSITINSSNLPYIDEGMGNGNQSNYMRYIVVDLEFGDTVTFYNSSGASHGLNMAILIENATFNKKVANNYAVNGQITYTPDSNFPCFIFGGISNERDTNYDTSITTGPSVFTQWGTMSYNTARWRAIGCYGADSATLDMNATQFAYLGYVVLQLDMVEPPEAEQTLPEFVVEYETQGTSENDTFTVENAGLYFLACSGAYNTASLTINSNNPTRIYHTLYDYWKTIYAVVELDVGDTVVFNSLAEAGINHAIRITNYGFRGFAFEKLLHDAWTQYSPVENYYPYFIYSAAGGHSTTTQDDSIIPSSCNTHTFSYENNKAKSRIVTCLGDEEEVLMKLYGYDHGGSTIVALRLTKTNT